MKKAILSILILSLSLSLPACAPKHSTAGEAERDNMRQCMEQGYFEGIPEELLYLETADSPEKQLNETAPVTPEMLCVMLANLSTKLGFNLNGYLKDYDSFSDVELGQWYSKPVHWVYIYEMMDRESPLGIGTPMTKEYFAALCYQYLNLYYEFDNGAPSAMQADFADSNSIENYERELAKMASLGLLVLDKSNNFHPSQEITLSQACELFCRLSDFCSEHMTLKKTFRHGIACDFRIVGYYRPADVETIYGEVDYDKPEFYQEIWDMGFDHIRLVLSLPSENPYPGECVDHVGFDEDGSAYVTDEFYEILDLIANLATDAGLFVVLDMHDYETGIDPLTEEGHQQNLAYFKSLWADIAQHYQGASDKIFLELMNEPVFEVDDTEREDQMLEDYMKGGVEAIRQFDSDRMIIVTFEAASYHGCAEGHEEMIAEFNQDPNIWYTAHNYEPYQFTIVNDRVSDYVNPSGKYYSFDEEMEKTTKLEINAIRESEMKYQIDYWVGEFGTFDNVTEEDRVAYYKASAEAYRRCQIAWCKWEISWGFVTYSPWTKTWNQKILDALFS